jgi:hypothetical protein
LQRGELVGLVGWQTQWAAPEEPGDFQVLGQVQVAARLCKLPLEVFVEWMQIGAGQHPKRRATPRFKAFATAIDEAEAQAVARKVGDLNRAIKGGRISAARWWLERRAPKHFPPPATRPAAIMVGGDLNLQGTTLIAQIQAIQKDASVDPRQAILEERRMKALAEAPKTDPLPQMPPVVELLDGDGTTILPVIPPADDPS